MLPVYRIAVFFSVASLLCANPPQRGSRGHASRSVQPAAARFEVDAVNNADQQPVKSGAKGSAVLRAQILLDRAYFSCGQLDGDFGSNLQKTVAAYQKDRQLDVSGAIDEPTWKSLNRDRAPALVSYTITPDDVKGPFIGPVPKEMEEQAKLPAMGYTSAEQEVSEKFHTSAAVLKALNPGADLTSAGQQIMVPNVIVMPPGRAARVVVSKSDSSVRAYDAGGRLLAFYVATIGSEHDPLPIGEWKIRGVAHNPEFHYNPDLFWDAKPTDSKVTIQPGPNNPVGVVWIDLSKDHYGIHGTPDPSLIGHTFSHGCIRLTNWDASQLAAMLRPGVPAILEE